MVDSPLRNEKSVEVHPQGAVGDVIGLPLQLKILVTQIKNKHFRPRLQRQLVIATDELF